MFCVFNKQILVHQWEWVPTSFLGLYRSLFVDSKTLKCEDFFFMHIKNSYPFWVWEKMIMNFKMEQSIKSFVMQSTLPNTHRWGIMSYKGLFTSNNKMPNIHLGHYTMYIPGSHILLKDICIMTKEIHK